MTKKMLIDCSYFLLEYSLNPTSYEQNISPLPFVFNVIYLDFYWKNLETICYLFVWRITFVTFNGNKRRKNIRNNSFGLKTESSFVFDNFLEQTKNKQLFTYRSIAIGINTVLRRSMRQLNTKQNRVKNKAKENSVCRALPSNLLKFHWELFAK